MKFVLKQKFWSLGDDFVIRDEEGRDCYSVDGAIFSFGDSLTIYDMAGREVAHIRQKLLSFGPSYEIERPGHGTTYVRKELFTLFTCSYEVDGPGDEDYRAEGDFLDHEYDLTRHGRRAGRVTKEWFTWSDSYGVEAAEEEDPVLILATAVVIDLVCHSDKER